MASIAEIRQQYPQYNDMSDGALADALHTKFYSDMPKDQFDKTIGYDPANDNPPDETGAPAHVRALVGSMPDANTRLQAIRKTYPDAQPHGDDNFVYTDPNSGKPTLYNPTGLDWGDLASLAPEAAEVVGGAAGAAGGAILGEGVGAIPGAGAGATAAKEAVQRAAMKAGGITDDRSAGQQATDAATTFALNATGQGAGELIGAGARAAVRGVARGGDAGRTATQAAIDDLSRFGVTPSVAQATKNGALDTTESLVGRVPGGAGVIRAAAQQQSETVAKNLAIKLKNLNSNVAPDTLAAGNAATQGVDDFAKNFGDKADVLYGKLDGFIPSDTPVTVSNTERTLAEIVTPAKGAVNTSKALVNPKLAQLQDAIGKDASAGAMTYSVLKDLRSSIGRKLGSASLVDDIPRAEMKRVYGALSDDLRFAAQKQGPDALKAFDRANTFYKAGMDRIDNLLTPLVHNKIPEQVFAGLESAADQGPTRLQALKQSVSPEQWNTIAATVADRLGKPRAGQQGVDQAEFSFQTFLTNWQRLNPRAKEVLFSGPKMGSVRSDLDALARSAGRIRESSKAFANPSGTSGATIGATMIVAGGGGALAGHPAVLLPILGAIGGSHAAAKLLTSPSFVNWLAKATKIAPNGIGAHIGRLSAIAADSDADTRNAIGAYLGALQSDPQENK